MDLSIGLSQRQTLSPYMQQGLQLLQAPMMDLRQLIGAELIANPVLEEEFSTSGEKLVSSGDLWQEEVPPLASPLTVLQDTEDRHRHFLESRASISTLSEVILAQSAAFPEKDHAIIEMIAGNLDPSGYLSISSSEIATLLTTSEQEVERVIAQVQQLDPPGVAARNLEECLLLQLERRNQENSLASRIVRHYLPSLARHHYEEIAAELHVSLSEVQQAHKIIATLEPHPGRSYGPIDHQEIIPDIIVIAERDDFIVRLNHEGIPRIRINAHYKEILSSHTENKELREYLRDKIRSGKQFMHSLDQREETMLLVSREIVRRQHAFFEKGIDALIPLTMAEVATAVNLHTTTISRTVSGKYMDTPQGLFAWKYFFTTGFQKEDGITVSNETIKESLQQLIHEENKSAPLSDQEIVMLLQERGITVARRTITNYRDQLHILPKNLRKRS